MSAAFQPDDRVRYSRHFLDRHGLCPSENAETAVVVEAWSGFCQVEWECGRLDLVDVADLRLVRARIKVPLGEMLAG